MTKTAEYSDVTTVFYFYGQEIGRVIGELNTLNRILFAIDWRWSFVEICKPRINFENGHAFDKNDLKEHILSSDCWCSPYQDIECEGLWVHRSSTHEPDEVH